MKKILCFIVCSCCAVSSYAQKSHSKHWDLSFTARVGKLKQDMTLIDFSRNYADAINVNQGTAKFENGSTVGIDLQLGYFFGKNANFGIGSGIMYLRQAGNITYDNFSITYRAVDANGDTYRQMLSTARAIKEKVNVDNVNIPVLLKYRGQFSKNSGISIDAGILYNLQATYSYDSKASFNYEAAYKFAVNGNAVVTVYDNGATPEPNDWLLTEQAYNTSLNDGNSKAYFASMRDQGYNVGLRELVKEGTGKADYKRGSIGFMVQPTYTHKLNDFATLRLGVYYTIQSFDNTANNAGFKITDKVGTYNPLVNAVSKTNNVSYGVNAGIGLRF